MERGKREKRRNERAFTFYYFYSVQLVVAMVPWCSPHRAEQQLVNPAHHATLHYNLPYSTRNAITQPAHPVSKQTAHTTQKHTLDYAYNNLY